MNIEIRNMNLDQLNERLSKLPNENEVTNLSIDMLEKHIQEVKEIEERKAEIRLSVENRQALEQEVLSQGTVIQRGKPKQMNTQINKDDLEMRSLQKYITRVDLSVEERSALVSSGASAVIPKNIISELITDSKYSDLLSRSTIFRENHRGETSVPISAGTSAKWKAEGTAQDSEVGALSNISLFGYELMRLISISSATDSLSANDFKNLLMKLLADEVIETLETAFITGTGTNQPQGLQALTYVADTNEVAVTGVIKAEDLAKAISLLPNKYSRNAIILANSTNLMKLSLMTSQTDHNLNSGSTHFLGKEIVENQNLSDDEIYIVDPSELYVKFAQELQVEADRSSGFRSATIDLRALAVVDAKWNQSATVKVSVTA